MTADAVLSRELNSLHEELSAASRRERPSPPAADASANRAITAPVSQPEGTAEEQHGELGNFVHVIKEFIEDAEKDVSMHPTASVIGAIIVGILIGRLLGRR